MSNLTLYSPIVSLSTHSSVLALANSTSSIQPYKSYSFEAEQLPAIDYQSLAQPPAFVLASQLTKLAKIKVLRYAFNTAWKAASFVYSRLPSLSLPSAAASSITASDTLPVCTSPTGSYLDSCHRQEVTYLPHKGECEITASCPTIYADMPYRKTRFQFPVTDSSVVLDNRNGTLVIHRSREDAVNEQLGKLSDVAPTPEALVKGRETIIGALKPGDVITVSSDLRPTLIVPKNWAEKGEAFNAFQRLAQATGGIMGNAPTPESLTPLMKTMSSHFLQAAESSTPIEIAFVIDTTGSMSPYIAQLQEKLVQLLEELQQKKMMSTCRVAVMEFRDSGCEFLNRVTTDLTSDLREVQNAIRRLKTNEGGDIPEAVLDALAAVKERLTWDPNARRIVVLIGDAPPKPKTHDGRYDETAIIGQYQEAGTMISVYPILTRSGLGG